LPYLKRINTKTEEIRPGCTSIFISSTNNHGTLDYLDILDALDKLEK